MKRNLYFYILLLVIAFLSVWLSFSDSNAMDGNALKLSLQNISGGIDIGHFTGRLLESPGSLILQLVVIMVFARIMGYVFQLISQPIVVGEIIAGLILGPSVLGALFPGTFNYLFSLESVDVLHQFSQLGLIFFMFIIGMELDLQSFRKSANKAFLISAASIIIPFISGILLAFYLYPEFKSGNVDFMSFSLFMGTTMCITAFPVLARIVQERKLTKQPVGIMAITVAAIGDVVAWCILAVVIALVKAGGISHSLITIALSAAYVLFMFYVIKPIMHRVGQVYSSREAMVKPIVALVFLLILVSSLVTEAIGIHALFGAFMAGVIIPENLNFKRVFTEKIEDISLVILLPLFFVSIGLRTEVGLINNSHLWMICLIITIVAIIGKFGGTLLASRYVGLTWNHSLTLGVLMNTKGLMELIILNIGYELGILGPEIFTMLILMAITTTILTGPGLSIVKRLKTRKVIQEIREDEYKIMLSFANPNTGVSLLRLTWHLAANRTNDTKIKALHISPRSDLSPDDARIFERESFAPVKSFARSHNLALSPIYLNSNDVYREIMRTSREEKPDFLILGSARTIFSRDILGGILKRIINEAPCDVLVFNERNFKDIRSVLLVYFGNGDEYIFEYARLLNHNSGKKFFAYHRILENKESSDILSSYAIPLEPVSGMNILKPGFLEGIDLVIVSAGNWKALEDKKNLPVDQFPSLLIIHKSAHENRMLKAERSQ
ncbi:MAG TPA: cation:proton antiporter [Bacteroidales bacterium]|jgi:Kef-type K+ transport system membrane component KefB|nr:cation:proton antiporter [Bacteroidales bacterium]